MPLFSTVAGFSLFGLASRFGQLSIQRKNLFTNPGGHLVAMGVFGYAGYWAHKWEIRSGELLAEKKQEILERRQQALAHADQKASSALEGIH
ncbi:hypothetical protein CVT24_006848 [Panaeolus cyanescens]|uniref:Uncharacterized protein n=1 Tax=Panaeolus cyanescens TaxID=181874 RepID=A0A409YS22_9AGAR|nr:hypothetical protein CVT24_006848 [Panaeolus cyanescens]